MRKRVGLTVVGVAALLVLLPAVTLAAGAPDALQGFVAALGALRDMTKDFYCAAGIAAFCP